jgi:hypothetical protein
MYTEMAYKSARAVVAAHCAADVSLKAVFLVHVQDEADIRLRSGDARDGPSVPRRGRASKVQAHVVTLVAGRSRRDIPTEIEALGDKTAPTLATSLEAVLRRIVCGTLLGSSAHGNGAREQPELRGGEVWVVHILVGDGVPTNLAAAKLIWASVARDPLGPRVRYFLVVVKCATHQAALTAKAAVIGSFAAAAGGELYRTIAGAAVRLFKYLVNDYYEEFCKTARQWVSSQLRVVPHGSGAREEQQSAHGDSARERRTATAHGLRELYTSHVISDEMMLLWNCGLSEMMHEVGAAVDPTGERPALIDRFVGYIIKELLQANLILVLVDVSSCELQQLAAVSWE